MLRDRRGSGAHRHGPSAPRQRGLLLRALAGLRRRRRHGRGAGGRGRFADRRGRLRRGPRRRQPGAGAGAGAPLRRTGGSSSWPARTPAAAGWARRSPARWSPSDEVSIVHVGDSRAYLFRDGELRQLTRDHSLVEELRRQGQLTSEEAEEHPQRSIITRALGPEPDVELDVHTHQARSGDVFLLCSDGLTSMVREDRVREILGRERSRSTRRPTGSCDEANEMGGRDNITVVCFRLGGDGGSRGASTTPATSATR